MTDLFDDPNIVAKVYRGDSDILVMVTHRKEPNIMLNFFGSTEGEASEKARTWWNANAAKYNKVDARRTTDPMGKLKRALNEIETLFAE